MTCLHNYEENEGNHNDRKTKLYLKISLKYDISYEIGEKISDTV